MGFFSELFSAAVKTVLTPVAIVRDAVDIATGEEPENTRALIESAINDAQNALEDLGDGEVF